MNVENETFFCTEWKYVEGGTTKTMTTTMMTMTTRMTRMTMTMTTTTTTMATIAAHKRITENSVC